MFSLNAVREVCARCPLVMNEDLMSDLAEYKNYRDRAVMMAARSLIQLFRHSRPELLHKRDRGKPTEASVELSTKQYGQTNAKEYIPGAEVLLEEHKSEVEINSENSDDEDEWVDIRHSSEDECEDGDDEEEVDDEADDEEEEEEGEDVEEDEDDDEVEENGNDESMEVPKEKRKILKAKRATTTKKAVSNEERKKKVELAKQVVLDRILTDEDFKRIELANAKKQIQSARKGAKRKNEETNNEPSELVKLGDIENIYKKRKHDKQTRLESVRRGQEDREKFGYKDGRMNIHCSKTNREKRKNKNFLMLKHKAKGKIKRSFKDKQIALRNHLVKQKRMR